MSKSHSLKANGAVIKWVMICLFDLILYSPRARNRFNQLVEAKRFEGVLLCTNIGLIQK